MLRSGRKTTVQHVLDKQDSMEKHDRIICGGVDSVDPVLVNLGEDTSSDYATTDDEGRLGCEPLCLPLSMEAGRVMCPSVLLCFFKSTSYS